MKKYMSVLMVLFLGRGMIGTQAPSPATAREGKDGEARLAVLR